LYFPPELLSKYLNTRKTKELCREGEGKLEQEGREELRCEVGKFLWKWDSQS